LYLELCALLSISSSVASANRRQPTKYKAQRSKYVQMKKSRAKQRGTSKVVEVFRVRRSELPELFSRLFCVAASRLNSPRFTNGVIRSARQAVKMIGFQ
jgi:hypothetical protein